MILPIDPDGPLSTQKKDKKTQIAMMDGDNATN